MSDSPSPPNQSGNMAGGCAMGCASLFVLVGLPWPLLHALSGTLDENVMFPVVLVGFPCFILAHILALIAVFSKAPGSKVWGKRALLTMWGSLVLAFVVVLLVPEPSSKKVVGTYDGSYRGVTEVLEMQAGGRFVQTLTLPSKEKLTATGTWELKHRAVLLDNYLAFIDLNDPEKNGLHLPPQEVYAMPFLYSSGLLIHDWGTGSYVCKRR